MAEWWAEWGDLLTWCLFMFIAIGMAWLLERLFDDPRNR